LSFLPDTHFAGKSDYAAIPTARAIDALTLKYHSGGSEVDHQRGRRASIARRRLKTKRTIQ
jgi:hypothetical protein